MANTTIKTKNILGFWDQNPCGASLSDAKERYQYMLETENKRYRQEPHIPIIAHFDAFRDKDVLEIGCGIGVDGSRFAQCGAHYTCVDLSQKALEITRERFSLLSLSGEFIHGNAEHLPFQNQSFDHIYSFGVIHHSPNTHKIIDEMYRLLKPGGTITVMVYNRTSINYYIEIMFLRKLFRYILYPKFMVRCLAKLTGFNHEKLSRHREILLKRRKISEEGWVSMNTDGPDCPLSKVYSAKETLFLFRKLSNIRMEIYYFNKDHWPGIRKIISPLIQNYLSKKFGWHRIIYAQKLLNCDGLL